VAGQSSQWVSGHWSVRLVKYVVDPSRLRARVLSALFLRICSKYVRFPSSDWNAKPFTWLIQTGSYVHDRFSSFSLINIQYVTRLRLVTYFLYTASAWAYQKHVLHGQETISIFIYVMSSSSLRNISYLYHCVKLWLCCLYYQRLSATTITVISSMFV